MTSSTNQLKSKRDQLPNLSEKEFPDKRDWLIDASGFQAGVYRGQRDNIIILTNGLVSRIFTLHPNGATIGYDNLMTGESLLRGIRSEARVSLDGQVFEVGGLIGQEEHAYILDDWIAEFQVLPGSFQLKDFSIQAIRARFHWKRTRPCEDRSWPPKGVELCMEYQPPEQIPEKLKGVIVKLHYECYDGIPLLSKWITVENRSKTPVRLNHYVNEILALVEFKTTSAGGLQVQGNLNAYPHIYFEYDYSFRGMTAEDANHLTHWKVDPDFSSQVAYLSDSKNMVESYIKMGPDVEIPPYDPEDEENTTFEGYREFQLVESSYDRERRGLARCQMYRTIAPWVTENPLMMHLTSFDPATVETAVEQMIEVGFEMLIFSFGSNLNMNVLEVGVLYPDLMDEMISEMKDDLIDPIHNKGIQVGGYSLLASRKISIEDDVVNPYTGKTSDVKSPQLEPGIDAIQGVDEEVAEIPGGPTFGNSPCLGSRWGQQYFDSLYKVFEVLDLDLLEHDGSYPGDVCASTKHPGHRGLTDSQWTQWKTISDFYKWCRGQGIYLNVPDWYMLVGSNKTGIGYKEVNWSLPRDRQVILGRQNIYDGTWEKTPSMGWTFCPLTQYHSVPEYPPEVATLEPLHEHLEHYEAHLAQNLGCGVQACYRGIRLYDTVETMGLVKQYVAWYKKYRDILDSDIVHIRRPDGRHIDGMLHVNPRLEIKGFAIFFNPSSQERREIIRIPLYYTGLTNKAQVREKEGESRECDLNRDYSIDLEVKIPAKKHTWFVFK